MKIRFDVNDALGRSTFIGRTLGDALASLSTESRPLWGGFTAAQMVEHLLWGFELSTGRRIAEAATSEEWQRKARAFLHDDRLMPRGFESPPLKDGVPPLLFSSIPEALSALTAETARFLEAAASEPASRRVHPVFGACSVEEWSRIHFKHGVHHLMQFGLIELVDPAE